MSECCVCSSDDRVLYPVRNPVTGASRHVCFECVQEIVALAAKYNIMDDDKTDDKDGG